MMPFDPDRQLLSNFRGFNFRFSARLGPPEHVPHRPDWLCLACSAEWPCSAARELLLREHRENPTAIAVQMWERLEQFSFDLGPGSPESAFRRFIDWTR